MKYIQAQHLNRCTLPTQSVFCVTSSLCNSNKLIFVMKTTFVYCEVETETLNIIQVTFSHPETRYFTLSEKHKMRPLLLRTVTFTRVNNIRYRDQAMS
jgi:hypothetical protein